MMNMAEAKAQGTPWVRVGSCDGCVGRHGSAFCCTTIDAGAILGRMGDGGRELFQAPSAKKLVNFATPLGPDLTRFYRLHGLDGTWPITLRSPEMDEQVEVFVTVTSRTLEFRSRDGSDFTLSIPLGDPSATMVLQTPCREYDWATRKCKIYTTRPRICRDFPVDPAQVNDTPCAFRFVPQGKVQVEVPGIGTVEMKPVANL